MKVVVHIEIKGGKVAITAFPPFIVFGFLKKLKESGIIVAQSLKTSIFYLE